MMKNRLLTLLVVALLSISLPAFAAASPGEHHHSDKPALDWKSYPADIQALKVQLDDIRTQHHGLFEQIKSQHEQIRSARRALTSEQRNTFKGEAKQLIMKMKASRDEIHSLREKKHDAWNSFHEHADARQWSTAKSDLQLIIKQKQQILEKQQNILRLQKKLIVLISPSAPSPAHTH